MSFLGQAHVQEIKWDRNRLRVRQEQQRILKMLGSSDTPHICQRQYGWEIQMRK